MNDVFANHDDREPITCSVCKFSYNNSTIGARQVDKWKKANSFCQY